MRENRMAHWKGGAERWERRRWALGRGPMRENRMAHWKGGAGRWKGGAGR